MLLLALSNYMIRQTYYGWMPLVTRLLFHMQNWAMVEVFLSGLLVGLVKIAHMATVVIGISFWGYGALRAVLYFWWPPTLTACSTGTNRRLPKLNHAG